MSDATNRRVAVVGGGPAGLTAAWTLHRAGVGGVTVFEAGASVGGKVRSVQIDDRSYELGAYVVTQAYDTVLELTEAVGLTDRLVQAPERYVIDVAGAHGLRSFGDFLKDERGLAHGVLALFGWMQEMLEHRELYAPGLSQADPTELFVPFTEYEQEERVEAIGHLFRPVFCSLGYGYYEDTPAMYVLKFIDWAKVQIVLKSALGVKQDWPRMFDCGFQELWRQVGERLDVRTNSPVTRISPTESGLVEVHTSDGCHHVFDEVILAVSPVRAVPLLHDYPARRSMLERFQTLDYRATLFRATGLDAVKGVTAYIAEHQVPETIGRTLLISQPWPENPDLFLSYAFAGPDQDEAHIRRTLAEDVAALGGELVSVEHHQSWPDYFPHLGTHALRDGVHTQLEALQGRGGLTLVGGLMNFETVEDSAAYAKQTAQALLARWARS